MLKEIHEQPRVIADTLSERIAGNHVLVDAFGPRANDILPQIRNVHVACSIGPLTASALTASAVDAKYFKSGRQLSAWLGLTPREHSSGGSRHLGRISKRGDVYVRMAFSPAKTDSMSV